VIEHGVMSRNYEGEIRISSLALHASEPLDPSFFVLHLRNRAAKCAPCEAALRKTTGDIETVRQEGRRNYDSAPSAPAFVRITAIIGPCFTLRRDSVTSTRTKPVQYLRRAGAVCSVAEQIKGRSNQHAQQTSLTTRNTCLSSRSFAPEHLGSDGGSLTLA